MNNQKRQLESELQSLIKSNQLEEEALTEKIEKETNEQEKIKMEEELKAMKSQHEESIKKANM